MSANDFIYHYQKSPPASPTKSELPPIHTVKMRGQPATVFIVVYDTGEWGEDRYVEILGVHSTLHDAGKHLTLKILPELTKRLDNLNKSNYNPENPFDILSDYYLHVFQMNRTESPKRIIELNPDTFSRESGFPNFDDIRHHSYVAKREIDWLNQNLSDGVIHQITQSPK